MAEPTKNAKHPGGRPRIFKSPEEMQKAIDEYFDWCDNRLVQGYDSKTNEQFAYISPAPYTMSGLARRLGMDRRTLIDYKELDEFLPAIKLARERVHEDVETRLMEKQATGAIFNLKNNFGWKDETKSDITSGGKPIPILSNLIKDDVHNNNSSTEASETE